MLSGKTVLLTGAGGGIGKAIVKVLVREGAQVAAHQGRARRNEHSVDSTYDAERVLPLYGDITDHTQLNTLWADAIKWHGRIDVLVNNAGLYAATPIDSEDAWNDGWQQNLAINLLAPAALCRHAITHFKETGEGIIVNMASRAAHRGDDAEHLAYGASKGGLLALTKGIAREFAADGTLAYAVAPAWVRTEMAEAHIKAVGETTITADLPMKEITPPIDVAETVAFLASGRARHANGCTIDITGAEYVR